MLNNYQIAYLKEVNPWWRNEYKCKGMVPRDCFPDLAQSVEGERFIIYISGARRTGKSTLLGQLGDLLYQKKLDLLYCSVEDILSYEKPEAFVDELIAFYEEQVVFHKIGNKRFFLILDEIHHLENWQGKIKRFYDNRKNLKFVLTSSISPALQKGKESLAGRIKEYDIQAFSFREFLRHKNECTAVLGGRRILREQFLSHQEFDLAKIKREIKKIIPFQDDLSMLQQQYMMNGGFPETLTMNKGQEIRNYFEEIVIKKVINEDIPMGFGVSDRKLLSRLFYYGIQGSSNEINMSRIADLQMEKKTTINNYFHYLEMGKLLHFIPKYAKSLAGQSRALKKVFAVDSGLFFRLQEFISSDHQQLMGPSAEIIVRNALRQIFSSLFYYRNDKKEEIDFLVETESNKIILLEIKFRDRIDTRTISLMEKVTTEFNISTSLIITKNTINFHKNGVIEIPLWAFLIFV